MPSPEKFRDSLDVFGVDAETRELILGGNENLVVSMPKKDRGAFFKRAVDVMNERLPYDTVRDILMWNACCKSGARERNSREFARINSGLPIEDRLAKIRRAPYLNMGSPRLEPDGTLTIDAVSYVYEGRYACACTNYRRLKRDYPVSKQYCCCCAGHFKYHYDIMLDADLTLREVVSSPLDSDGASPCVFSFEIGKKR